MLFVSVSIAALVCSSAGYFSLFIILEGQLFQWAAGGRDLNPLAFTREQFSFVNKRIARPAGTCCDTPPQMKKRHKSFTNQFS